MGLLRVPDDRLVDIEQVGDLEPARTCVISTGSQGEPLSALALMAAGENKWLEVGDGDVVVLSSHAIPGNEHNVNKVIDGLWRLGAEVVHAGLADAARHTPTNGRVSASRSPKRARRYRHAPMLAGSSCTQTTRVGGG